MDENKKTIFQRIKSEIPVPLLKCDALFTIKICIKMLKYLQL